MKWMPRKRISRKVVYWMVYGLELVKILKISPWNERWERGKFQKQLNSGNDGNNEDHLKMKKCMKKQGMKCKAAKMDPRSWNNHQVKIWEENWWKKGLGFNC
jgi:hypothetical protein